MMFRRYGPMENVSDELGGGYIVVSVTNKVDIVLIVAGLDMTQEAEDCDRFRLLLSGYQFSPIQVGTLLSGYEVGALSFEKV
ncbi:hypothetical protein Tco_1488846, partial [Tanacetum coccineum]